MRIGLFCDMYLPHVSGVTNHVGLYKRRYEELGHEVFVFTFGDLDYADNERNIIRTNGVPWGRTGWRFSASYSKRARRLIRTLDVAHVHHPFQSGLLVLPLARRNNIPVVFTNHTRYDLYSDAYARFVPPPVRHAFIRTWLGHFARACDLVIAPAPSIAHWLETYCGFESATVIPNGIDIESFADPVMPVEREELGFATDDAVFCYVGRLGPEKNTRWLVEEFTRAATAAPAARLLVIGDGPSRAEAEATLMRHGLGSRARFLGMQPYERVPAYEAAADVFVTGSVSEVHPLVVLEAMAVGLPVLAVHSPGISDTIEDDVSGLLASSIEPGALAQRMISLTKDPTLRARLRAGAKAAALSYSLERTADVVCHQYEHLVAARIS